MKNPFKDGFFSVFKPQPTLTVSEWSERFRVLPKDGSSEPGQWRNARTPYLVEIMDVLSDTSRVREVVFCKGTQLGATEGALNWLMYLIDHVGGPILALQPTDNNAAEWSKQRISPSLALCDRLREKVRPAKSRATGNTIMIKEFDGGQLFLSGTNSPRALASKPVGNIYCDEIDRWESNVGKEGDPLSLVKQRAINFPRAKIFVTSTPTLLETSTIWDLYQKSDQRAYEVPCPYCGHHQEIVFERLMWDRGDYSDVRLACGHCGSLIEEHHKTSMLAAGKWRAKNPGHWRVGFLLSSLYSPLGWLSWAEIARRHEEADGDADKTTAFVNTILGLPYEGENESIAEEFLKRRVETYKAEVPIGVLLLTMAVDVQGDRLEYEIKGWGEGSESWGIEYRVLYGDPGVLKTGDPSNPSVWEQLDACYIDRVFTHEDGGPIRVLCTMIDSGGSHTDVVYQYTGARRNYRVFSIKGSGAPARPLLNKQTKGGKDGVPLYILGVTQGKNTVFANLKKEAHGPGYCHFPDDENRGYNGAFYAGLVAERRCIKIRNGQKAVVWELPSNKLRNEPFDISVYNTAAKELLNPPWKRLREQREGRRGVGNTHTTMPRSSGRIPSEASIELVQV